MGTVRDLSERLWRGEQNTHGVQPVSLMLGLEQYQDGLAFISTFGNVTLLDTREGLVLLDTGGFFLAGQNHAIARQWSKSPLAVAIYTHGHVDHAFGVPPYDEEAKTSGQKRPHVIGHEKVVDRFQRYQLTAGYNRVINGRQFGAELWPTDYRYPDETVSNRLEITLGGEHLEIRHARGETDDHLWIWLPERKAIVTGDLFIWASPNCGNPQKVQRYPREWSFALRDMAKLGAELLLPGHGPPIEGADRVRLALSETAELLEFIVNETLQRMNAGARLDQVLADVRPPARLLERPYLRPVYDEPEFIVRNLWRLYGGWWDGNPAHLKPAREADLAREIAALTGGPATLVSRALALKDEGNLALASHLVELAFGASPDDASVLAARKAIYSARAEAESSLMARAIFRSASER
jgi:glyoxylase-like metal-dependent hydrolase (beta-lactamase superfamily II)